MRNIVSRIFQIFAWFTCTVSGWLTLVSLQSFRDGKGWGGIVLVYILLLYVPLCLACCVGPLAYLTWRGKSARDVKSLKMASSSVATVALVAVLALWLAPEGNGC